jgi:hypothetical protein
MNARAREEELVVQELENELLVYDLQSHLAHSLNPTAAAVWKQCDGTHSIAEIAAAVKAEPDAVHVGLRQLHKAGLLADWKDDRAGLTRRELVKRVAVLSAAVPVVTSIVAPTAAEEASRCAGLNEVCDSIECCTTPGLLLVCTQVIVGPLQVRLCLDV